MAEAHLYHSFQMTRHVRFWLLMSQHFVAVHLRLNQARPIDRYGPCFNLACLNGLTTAPSATP